MNSARAPVLTTRVACADLPALPLQLTLREHPHWKDDPVVVVEESRPQARILWVNRIARQLGVERGSRFCQAQALASCLHAAVLPGDRLREAGDELLALLLRFSPAVEPSRDRTGLFFLDAGGIEPLYTSIEEWADRLHASLTDRGWTASVTVGFHRYRTSAIGRTHRRCLVLADPDQEARLARTVPLTRLDISCKLRDQMELLGVRTLGEFLELPGRDLKIRYGEEAARLHALAGEELRVSLSPELPPEPSRDSILFDSPEGDLPRLLQALEAIAGALVARLREKGHAMTALLLTLDCGREPVRRERIETSGPTLDLTQLLELAGLRLASERLEGPVERLTVEMESVRLHPRQLQMLLFGAPKRDLEAAARALARVKAAFGPETVVRAVLLKGHLPEARFKWQPASRIALPRALPTRPLRLIRLLYPKARQLPAPPMAEDDSRTGPLGGVKRLHGPFRMSGGWWRRRVERDYFYAETKQGEILWLYFDRRRRRWFSHGVVD